MPTARELLEQADALMRRKPEPAGAPALPEASAGPPTDSTFGVTEGRTEEPPHPPERTSAAGPPRQVGIYDAPPPREAPRDPSAPRHVGIYDAPAAGEPSAPATATAALASMRWTASAPAAPTPTSSPVFAAPPIRSPRTIQREPIAPSAARSALPLDPANPVVPPPRPAIAAEAEQDFPVLTDAVPPEELPALAGSDDVPLLMDAVDPLADEPILEDDLTPPDMWTPTFGAAPTVGPAPAVPATVQADASDPLGLDRPPPGFEAAHTAQWDGRAPLPEPDVPAVPLEAEAEREVDAVEPVAERPADAAEPQSAPVAVDAEPPASAPASSAPAPVVLAPLDDARVREIAEEIGMQVLQRIDIFTDTELRARLGERLKPVVERVSAELVAAINQHVGELLRAYVAEAIEREIDRWRDTHA